VNVALFQMARALACGDSDEGRAARRAPGAGGSQRRELSALAEAALECQAVEASVDAGDYEAVDLGSPTSCRR